HDAACDDEVARRTVMADRDAMVPVQQRRLRAHNHATGGERPWKCVLQTSQNPPVRMARVTAWILALTKCIGGVGIFVIAFLDSSFLSFPVVTDATIISMVAAHRERVLFS